MHFDVVGLQLAILGLIVLLGSCVAMACSTAATPGLGKPQRLAR